MSEFDVPLLRLEVVDDFQNAFDVFAVILTDFIEGRPGFVRAVRADVHGGTVVLPVADRTVTVGGRNMIP